MTMTKRDAEIEAACDHEIGCFDTALEMIVEQAGDEGDDLTGDIDEMWRGMTNEQRAHRDMVEGTIPCHCEGEGPEGFTGRRAHRRPSAPDPYAYLDGPETYPGL